MKFKASRRWRAALAATLTGGLLTAAGAAAELTPEEELGRQIYFDGLGAEDRDILAVMAGGTEVSAAVMPCATCHGADGKGRPEGGLSPSNVTWPQLTKPYGTSHPSGREHPPYNESLVKRAVTMGIDAGGNPLHVAMPRYRLTHREAAALVACLKRLGQESERGVDETRVRLGVVLPPPGPLSVFGAAVRGVLQAAAARVNDSGGIYNRRLELSFSEPPETAAERRRAVAGFVAGEELFALTASFIAGADAEIAALMAEAGVPLVGPFSVRPQTDFPLNPYVFYLVSGFPEQARALVDFAARKLGERARRVVVIHPRREVIETVAAAIREQGRKHGEGPWSAITALSFAPGDLSPAELVRGEQRSGTDVVFFLGSERETAALVQAAARLQWRPHLFLLSPLSGRGVFSAPLSFAERIFLSFPSLPGDTRARGFASYQQLAEKHRLSDQHLAGQLTALAAFELLVEALERSGRDLSRDKLIATLEGLYQYETALTPSLTYGPNRRIGALGAYVVSPDLENQRFPLRGEWITPR